MRMVHADVRVASDRSSIRATHWRSALIAYYRSGWAFLLPYLGFYLLYVWIKGPLNPVAAGVAPPPVGGASLPSLLELYWMLHLAHLIGAVVAFFSYVQN